MEKSNKGTSKLVIRKQNDREPLLSDTLFPYSLNYSKWNSEESYSYSHFRDYKIETYFLQKCVSAWNFSTIKQVSE
ncbi:hypothetical protein T01_2157 [Trichinella spiralis]|uniref:Uncharacterized protein n=1 Tax=Trichinella spiralis TaxID=6334 RepID=A0A0V1ATA5_TRISP|nr:hypothetical protein T01_2157 [Trichinella spiralis]